MKLSIFCDTFKNATAQRNQISTFPATSVLLEAATWASTSLSVIAKAGTQRAAASSDTSSSVEKIRMIFFVLTPPYRDSGFAIKAPTMLTNSRKHHAFISSRKICPANIRHQLLKMLDVA